MKSLFRFKLKQFVFPYLDFCLSYINVFPKTYYACTNHDENVQVKQVIFYFLIAKQKLSKSFVIISSLNIQLRLVKRRFYFIYSIQISKILQSHLNTCMWTQTELNDSVSITFLQQLITCIQLCVLFRSKNKNKNKLCLLTCLLLSMICNYQFNRASNAY